MKAICGVVLCAFIIFIGGTSANTILGKFDTSSNSEYAKETSYNGESEKFDFSAKLKEYTSWEVKPDKSCIKRVVVEVNGFETKNDETPIDCAKAEEEVKVFEEKARKEIEEQLKKVKLQQEKLQKEHAEFAAKIQKELSSMKSSFNLF